MALKYLYVPSGYKAGTAYGVLPNVSNADFSFVRGSAGTRVNADGLLESEVTDVPRLDYTDGSCPTLLTEPQRINLAKYSEQINSWGKNFKNESSQHVLTILMIKRLIWQLKINVAIL